MTRKNAAAAYFNGEIANEVRERGLFDIYITKNKTREDLMKQIDSIRKEELYEHREEDCSPLCKSKGCNNLRVIDSCWKFLNAAGRYDLMETVLNYIKDVLIPYYKEIINPSIRDVADTPTSNLMKTLLNICTSQQGNGVTTIVNSTLAVKSDSIKDPSLRKEIQALGGKLNHSVRLNGKLKKCVTIPKTSMTEEQWKSVASAMLKAVPPPTTTDRAAVPPPTTTDRVAVPPPTTTDEAAVPPPTTTDEAAVPPPTTTDEAAVPPPTTTDEAALPAQATHRTVPQLPFPIQKLQKKTITTCFNCKKVGSKFLHWVACDGCRKWYHRKCTTLSCKDYLKLTEDSVWNCDICIV
ncbi:uncharacterized protein LOC125650878 isoform X2 [Ostrea edulis]|uniref:uncharacterized protein LOC125650878 isoform X2 n=1 Tax=Ostrea edulis TaxID=37623 RepID=UPI0024AEC9E0|nr:uncharacterized protein LOC125650878 isoform X2 [Ostrea edulis]